MTSNPHVIPGQFFDLRGSEFEGVGTYWGKTATGDVPVFFISGDFGRRFVKTASQESASNLHLFPMNDKLMLVAFEEGGRLVVVDRPSLLAKLLLIGIFAFGLLTILFFGAGLVILFLWWNLFKKSRPSVLLERYVRTLPAVERLRG